MRSPIYVDIPLDDLRQQQLDGLSLACDVACQTSFEFDFGQSGSQADDATVAPAGVKHIQMRDTIQNPDQDNWTRMHGQVLAAIMLAGGDPSKAGTFPIRVEENVTVAATAVQVLTVLGQVTQRNAGYIIGQLPAKKHALNQATTAVDILAVTWT